jgi:AbiV family abortive infection protein
MAAECLANARQLFRDAKRLKSAGSRGHAIALAILSIEESSKSLICREVSEGVLRIVSKNPNHVTSFTESELVNHRFKHGILANAFIGYLQYGPFYEVAERLRKPRFSKADVRDMILRAVHAHRIMQVDLQTGGRTVRDIQRVLVLLERLNDLKNRGLYVDDSKGKVVTPNQVRTKELEEVLGLAEAAIEISAETLRRPYSAREKQLQKDANAAMLSSLRTARRRAATNPKVPGR